MPPCPALSDLLYNLIFSRFRYEKIKLLSCHGLVAETSCNHRSARIQWFCILLDSIWTVPRLITEWNVVNFFIHCHIKGDFSITVVDDKFCSKKPAWKYFFNGKSTSVYIWESRTVQHFCKHDCSA